MALLCTESEVEEACAILTQESVIAVDCEGENLGEKGKLSIVQVSAEDGRTFIFDVHGTTGKVFDWGLKELLEKSHVVKLMFDCRQDVAALEVLHSVSLSNIRDLQLLEVFTRHDDKDQQRKRLYGVFHHGNVEGQPHLYKNLYRLASFAKCLEEFDLGGDEVKTEVTSAFRSDMKYWMQRPLPQKALEYASKDAAALFDLLRAIQLKAIQSARGKHSDFDMSTNQWLQTASARYARLKIAPLGCTIYHEHSVLPLCVIDGIPIEGLDRRFYTVKCTCCQRFFPREIFSKTALTKPSSLRCDVCRAIDIQSNTERQWAKNDSRYDSDDWGDDFSDLSSYSGNS
eukprot:TRINITY_DN69546_c0_g1_i1.p1 TRINITY_DN69546_c0_g1~~TRINITY_DN69546_c0_g1_i1.p1  ORF type:complete len:343 (-),score=60.92 TRINITY_DN69546_c0_g1_i1:122-1150(-)